MVTWIRAAPYPYTQNAAVESADFQVVLATNGSHTSIMYNYDQEHFTWKAGHKVAVGYSKEDFTGDVLFNSNTFRNVTTRSNSGVNGRWQYNVTTAADSTSLYEARCLAWATDQTKQNILVNTRRSARPCPCSIWQAQRDRRFRYRGSINDVHMYSSAFYRWPNSHRQRCHYRSSGSLVRGYPNGGYLEFSDPTYVQDAYDNCCNQSTLCNVFYLKNPSNGCQGYRPPSWVSSAGDPHLTSLDGKRYTFNGKGEYTLLKLDQANTSVNVQVRTDYVATGKEDATVFVGIAAQVGGSGGDKVELLLDPGTKTVTLYVNGTLTTTLTPPSMKYTKELKGIIVEGENSTLYMMFESGLGIQVSVSTILDLVVAAPPDGVFAGNATGLLGNNDGDPENDFVLADKTKLASNSTESQLFDFGMSWNVNTTTTLFSYADGGNWTTHNPKKRPTYFFGDPAFNLTAYLSTQCPGLSASVVNATCGNNRACITDTAATCNTTFGARTKQTEETVQAEKKLLDNNPPSITAPGVLTIYRSNTTLQLNMSAYVSDPDHNLQSQIAISTTTAAGKYTYDSNVFTWNLTSTELWNQPMSIYLRFTANDTLGATSEYWPKLYYCGCVKDEQCDFSMVEEDNKNNPDRFFLARCNCGEFEIGQFCDKLVNVCDSNPCAGGVGCNDTNPSDPCGSCPDGYTGNGIKCVDINECNQDNGGCNQVCENTEGSRSCSCNTGYHLTNDTKTNCTDIDECGDNTHTCSSDDNRYCLNVDGGFECPCKAGYRGSSTGACTKVTAAFVGVLIFTIAEPIVNTGTWETELSQWIKVTVLKSSSVDSVDIISLVAHVTRRRRAADDSGVEYNCTFLVHKTGGSTQTISDAFKTFIETKPVHDVGGKQIVINEDASKIYTDDDNALCSIKDLSDCDPTSTKCVSSDGKFSCHCKPGYEEWPAKDGHCKDIDECLPGNGCDNTGGQCKNTPGSFTCSCPNGWLFLANQSKCDNLCEPNPCQNDGTCQPGNHEGHYVCKCDDKWAGPNCERENSEASSLKTVAIAVGASLGGICLLLLFVILGMYRRNKHRRMGYSSRPLSTLDFDGLTGPRTRHYNTPKENGDDTATFAIPRPKVNQTYEMMEADSASNSENGNGKSKQEAAPRTRISGATPRTRTSGADSDDGLLGTENPSFLHDETTKSQKKTETSRNQYEYF